MTTEYNPQSPEQSEIEAKRFEAQRLAGVAGILSEMINGKMEGFDGADGAVDLLHEYCESLAKRDESMGHLLIRAMEEHEEARRLDIPTAMREALGLPVSAWPDYPPVDPVPDPYDQPSGTPEA